MRYFNDALPFIDLWLDDINGSSPLMVMENSGSVKSNFALTFFSFFKFRIPRFLGFQPGLLS
jgi:hypothetical protein